MKTLKTIPALALVMISTCALAQTKGEMPLSGSSPEINKMIRECWIMMGDAKGIEAREQLTQIREKDPELAVSYLFATTEPEEEKKMVEKALTLRASPDEKIFIEGRKAALEKKLSPTHFDPLLKKYPNDKQIVLHVAWLTAGRGDSKRSVEILSNLIKKFPDHAAAYNIRGYQYMALNEMEKAGADFDKYISLRPELANPYDSKADYFMKSGKIEEAIPLYEKAAKLDPKNMANAQVRAENAKNKLYGFKIPERTAVQKHSRATFQAYAGLIAGIALTKKSGGSAKDYGIFCGDLFKTSWNRAGGFEGFVRGTLLNFEGFRREADPAIEILSQDNNSIQFKWKTNYGNAVGYGVSAEELSQWMESTYVIIADYLGANYSQEPVDTEWLKITITRKVKTPSSP
ncbi:tetratricopeptide repeat protein [Oscillatoria amoena NRMC-F 0135]|nr:tetratricopeptide repeat protein [Oscillatoria amoena NRMC-F 0135]